MFPFMFPWVCLTGCFSEHRVRFKPENVRHVSIMYPKTPLFITRFYQNRNIIVIIHLKKQLFLFFLAFYVFFIW
jgi:hypothetical protein